MKQGIKYSEFQDDLLRLYCKTKHSAIEDIYLKFSQNLNQNLLRWIRTNNSIKDSLRNPSVYSALETLDLVKMRVGNNPSISNIIRVLTPSPTDLKNIPIILAFAQLMTGEAKEILSPFSDIISAIASKLKIPSGQDAEDPNVVSSDLLIIQNAFHQEKAKEVLRPVRVTRQTLQQQRSTMFSLLLKRFSDEMAVASEAQGFNDLASAFRSGVLAIPAPFGISKHLELDSISEDQMRVSKKLADYVFQYPGPDFSNYHHDLIEIDLLQHSGGLTEEDAYKFKETYESEKNVMDYLDEKEKTYVAEVPGIETSGKITDDTRMNPDYIYMLAMFFLFMQKRLRMPPMSLGLV